MNRAFYGVLTAALAFCSVAQAQVYHVVDSDFGGPMLLQYTALPSYNSTIGGWDFPLRATNTSATPLSDVGLTLQFIFPISNWGELLPIGPAYTYVGPATWHRELPTPADLTFLDNTIGGAVQYLPTANVAEYSLISQQTSHNPSISQTWNAADNLPFEVLGDFGAGQHKDFTLHSQTPHVYLDNWGYFLSRTQTTLSVPEPSSLALFGLGAVTLAAMRVAQKRLRKCEQ